MAAIARTILSLLVSQALCMSTVNAQHCSRDASILLKAPWATQLGWDAAVDVSRWTGLMCDPSTGALSIGLSNRNLSSSLPDAWCALSQLAQLDMSGNKITGTLPSSWSNLTQIGTISLSNNSLVGTLPDTWGTLRQLRALDLRDNMLTGSLPSSWSSLIYLGLCGLTGNMLRGTLPTSWSKMDQLSYLALGGNTFTGTTPSSWGNLTQLNYIDMTDSELTGTLPSLWGNLRQMRYATFADNQLSGHIPLLPSITVFNMSTNKFTEATFTNLPACKLLYFANNSLTGAFPVREFLPANLTMLDLSDNRFSGSLPSALPPNLIVLNVSGNSLTGQLPGSWSALEYLVELRLDNNLFTGKLPAAWSAWGKRLQNSLQLSVLNSKLGGKIPQQWVQQFCLSIVTSTGAQVLGQPMDVTVVGVTVLVGPDIQLPAQHASINVTLGNRFYSFDYNTPDSICGITDAARNLGILWGIFAALLILVPICLKLWLRRKQGGTTSGLLSKLGKITAYLHHEKLHIPKQVAVRLQYFLLDIVYFVYSQVTDAVTIHQVVASGQLRYAYFLLAVLLLPYAFTLLPVARVSIKVCQCKVTHKTRWHAAGACVAGLLLSPVMMLALEFGMLLHGVGIPVPPWLKPANVDLFTMHRLQTFAESFLNAFPQSVLQSKLYLMGNDPHGVHVYIDTTLFLLSMVGSMVSMLKTIAVFCIEQHAYSCGAKQYLIHLLKLEPLDKYTQFVQSSNSLGRADSAILT